MKLSSLTSWVKSLIKKKEVKEEERKDKEQKFLEYDHEYLNYLYQILFSINMLYLDIYNNQNNMNRLFALLSMVKQKCDLLNNEITKHTKSWNGALVDQINITGESIRFPDSTIYKSRFNYVELSAKVNEEVLIGILESYPTYKEAVRSKTIDKKKLASIMSKEIKVHGELFIPDEIEEAVKLKSRVFAVCRPNT